MDVRLHRPDRSTIRMNCGGRSLPAAGSGASTVVGVAVRGILVGAGIGVLLVAGSLGITPVVVIGVLALGAALMSWDL